MGCQLDHRKKPGTAEKVEIHSKAACVGGLTFLPLHKSLLLNKGGEGILALEKRHSHVGVESSLKLSLLGLILCHYSPCSSVVSRRNTSRYLWGRQSGDDGPFDPAGLW